MKKETLELFKLHMKNYGLFTLPNFAHWISIQIKREIKRKELQVAVDYQMGRFGLIEHHLLKIKEFESWLKFVETMSKDFEDEERNHSETFAALSKLNRNLS